MTSYPAARPSATSPPVPHPQSRIRVSVCICTPRSTRISRYSLKRFTDISCVHERRPIVAWPMSGKSRLDERSAGREVGIRKITKPRCESLARQRRSLSNPVDHDRKSGLAHQLHMGRVGLPVQEEQSASSQQAPKPILVHPMRIPVARYAVAAEIDLIGDPAIWRKPFAHSLICDAEILDVLEHGC